MEEERLGIPGISQLRLLHRALIAPGNFPTGFTALFSPVALECTLSPKGKRELRTNTLSLKREKEIYIYRTEKKDEIAVGDASVPRLILDLVKPPPLLNFALWLARRW